MAAAIDELPRDRSAMLLEPANRRSSHRQIQTLRRTHGLLLPRLRSGQVELALDVNDRNHPRAR